MDNSIWAGQVGETFEYGTGEVLGTGTVTDVNVEEKVVTIATEPAEVDPVEEAAMRFTQLLPFVSKIAAASSSQKGLVRVLHALAEFPLGKAKPRLLNANERQLFAIMQELNGYKSTVLTSIIKQNAAMEAATKQAPDLSGAETEVSNGTSEN